MTQENTVISFVGQKISKIAFQKTYTGSYSTSQFLTGSWDDDRNQVCQWKIPVDEESSNGSVEPYVMSSIPIQGSVTDLRSLSANKVICTSSCGDVSIVTIDEHNGGMSYAQQWRKIHRYQTTNEGASCDCLDVNENEILTGGEDGRLNILHADRNKPVRTYDNADSSNITGVRFLTSSEAVSVNTTGQLKLWDIRSHPKDQCRPEKVLTLSGNACPLLSVDKHPNQPHILVTGHGDGAIGIWDIRQEKSPVTLIDAHQSNVWEVKFHPLYPDNLFTCSQDGTAWFWDGTTMISGANYTKTMTQAAGRFDMSSHQQQSIGDAMSSSVWLYVDANKHKMETFSLIPFSTNSVNSFDVNGSTLVCCTDNEAIIIVNDIPVR